MLRKPFLGGIVLFGVAFGAVWWNWSVLFPPERRLRYAVASGPFRDSATITDREHLAGLEVWRRGLNEPGFRRTETALREWNETGRARCGGGLKPIPTALRLVYEDGREENLVVNNDLDRLNSKWDAVYWTDGRCVPQTPPLRQGCTLLQRLGCLPSRE